MAPESFTHGSAQERQGWLRRGLESGDPGPLRHVSGSDPVGTAAHAGAELRGAREGPASAPALRVRYRSLA